MAIAAIRFRRKRGRRASIDALERAAETLPLMLWKNGQIEGEGTSGWVERAYCAWYVLAEPDSPDERHATPLVTEALGKVVEAFGGKPTIEVLGGAARHRPPSWQSARSLLLFTHAFDRASPVCRGESRHPVPIYRLPLDQREREDLITWAHHYRKVDSLWFDGGVFEDLTYRQMADPAQELLTEGREFAHLIEERTCRPTFLYVQKYCGRKGEEAKRRCPSCGGKWTRKKGRGPIPAWYFPVRCDPCRFVSDNAVDFDLPRLAGVGDFLPSSRPSGSRRSTPRRAR